MAKQLNVSLNFSANTAEAKKSIQELNTMLTKIQTQPGKMFDDVDLKKASQAAKDLQGHLQAATNVDTGKLDLNKFSQSLTKSNQNLRSLYTDLNRIGPEGQAAFLKMAQSINAADNSALNLGTKLRELGTSLANTARWQISSSILHGLMGAVQGAFRYAQDLNESLNNIRIVTGQSAEQMEKFAEKANKAARALSTTTTEYTNASLIFYQQGLSDEEVAKRTEVTIKMANAAGQSAQVVSDQLTSVWNNFYDGSKSLEYYADVMTALGATTASSADEIAGGLEKFAAIGDTVGLSYEYAAAALATITSNTRQSEEVVGTALKTIFARLQGLKLGETLEDGVDLNKYSEALQKVGVEALDATGELRRADDILTDMAAKWETLSNAEQVALAQAVGGVRQYNQIVALMDEWDSGDADSMQANLKTAYGAEGELQKQADIYAESWEAARDRVAAAAESIYQSLLDDDFFITVLDGFESFLGGIENVIDGLGGLKGVLLLVGGIFMQHFAKEIPKALSTVAQNFDVITGKAAKNKQATMDQNVQALNDIDVSGTSDGMNAEIQSITRVSEMSAALEKQRKNLSDTELKYYQNKIAHVKAYGDEATAIGKENDELKKLMQTKEASIAKKAVRSQKSEIKNLDEEIKKQEELVAAKKKAAEEATTSWEQTSDKKWSAGASATKAMEAGDNENYIVYKQQALQLESELEEKYEAQQAAIGEVGEAEKKLAELKQKRAKAGENQSSEKALRDQLKTLEQTSIKYQTMQSALGKISNQGKAWQKQAKDIKDNQKETDKLKESMVAYLKHLKDIGLGGEKMDEFIQKIQQGDISLEQAATELENWKNGVAGVDTSRMTQFEQEIEQIEQKLLKLGVSQEDLDDLALQFESGAISAEQYRQALDRLNQEAGEMPKHIMSASEGFGLFAGKAMQLMSVITSLQGLGSIWKDEDLSTGQKIMQTMSALIPVITLATSWTNKKAMADMKAGASAILNAVGLGVSATAQKGETASVWASVVAWIAKQAAMAPVLVVTLLLVAAIGLLVLGVMGLVAAWKNYQANTPEGKMKTLKEEAEELTKTLDETKQKAEELQQSFDTYDSVVEKLSECKKGTEEWRDALNEVNNTVLQLLQDYPELASYVDSEGKAGIYRDEKTGALTVNENWRNEQQDKFEDQIFGQTAALQQNQVRQHKLNENQAMLDAYGLLWSATGQEFSKYDYETGESDFSRMKDFTDAYMNSDNDKIKTMLGQNDFESLENDLQIRMRMAEKGIDYDSLSEDEKRQEVNKALVENGWVEKGQEEQYLQGRIDNLYKAFEDSLTNSGLDEALRKYSTAIDTTTAAQEAYNDSMAQTLLADNEIVQNSKYADAILDISGNKYGELVDSNYNQRLNEITDRSGMFGGIGTDTAKAAMEEYAKLMGLDTDENYKVTNYKANGKVTYKYTDANGDVQKKTVDAETIASALAAADANEALAASAENLVATFAKLDESEAAAVTAATTGDASQLNLNQIRNGVDASSLGLTQEDLDTLGYATIDELQSELDAAIAEARDNWDQTISTYSSGAQEQMNQIADSTNEAINSISQATVLNYGQMIQDVQQMGGQAAADNMGNALTTLMSENADKAEEIMQAASGIDWSQGEGALNELKGQLFDLGIYIDENSSTWQAFQNTVNGFNSSVVHQDLNSIRTEISEIADIAGDIELGDIISDEDYNTLVAYNGALKEMFALTADGYMYIGDGDIGDIALQAATNQLDQTKQKNENAINAFKSLDRVGWNDSEGNFTKEDWYGLANGTDSNTSMASMTQFLATNKSDAVSALGWDSGYLSELATIVGDTTGTYTSDQIEAAKAQLQSFYGEIIALNTNYEQGLYDNTQAEEVFASTLKSMDDLKKAYEDSTISLETYEKMQSVVLKNEAEAAGIDWDEVTQHADILQENSEYLKNNREEALQLALSYKKWEKGVKTMSDKFKDWTKAIKNQDKDMVAYQKTVKEIKEAYKDVFNEMDPKIVEKLSDEFLTSEKNLDLLEKGLNGNEDAWNEWEALVAQEINSTIPEFQSMSDSMKSQMNDLVATAAGLDFSGLTPGADIQDAAFLSKLANMTFATEAAAQAMCDNLSNIGVDAELVPHTVTVPANSTVTEQDGAFIVTPPGGEPFTVPVSAGITQSEEEKTYTYYTLEGAKYNGKGVTPGTGTNTSGGGGGGGKKTVEKKTKRNDGSRYHHLEKTLGDLESTYEGIAEAADRAFGADKLELMDAQIEKTKELQQQNEDYIESLQENLAVDKEVMKAQYKNLIGDGALEFDIDANGNIANYDDIEQQMIDAYNEKAVLYETGKMSEEDWQAYEQLWEQTKKDIEQYEESDELLRDALARRKELEYQEINEKLAKIEYAAEVKLEISQDELDIIEYQLELLDDKAFSSADKIAQNVTKASNLVEQMETTQQAMDDILSVSGISDSDITTLLDPETTEKQMAAILHGKNITADQVDSIRNYRDSLLDMNRDLIEVRNTIREEVTNAFEEWNEELDKGISKFDHYNSVLESYQNIIGIVGKDALGISDEMMAEMSATKVENSINQLNSMREKYESITKARDDALARSKDMSLTQEDRDYWAEQYEIMNESAQEAQEELMSTWESTLEGIVAQFEESVQRAVDAFNKAIYDGGLESLSEDFEWNQEMDDMYIEDYEKIYELSKLTRDINRTMDDTKSIAGKQKLKGLIEDINKLQEEGVEMSEYDLEYLQAEYDLRLAEIALEDAQRAKDTVRLSRDSEGNFSYVYTQNTDAVDEAQQKYEDALYSMQDLSSNYIDEMSAQLIETSQAMQEELAALRVEDYASIDEYYAAVAEVEAKYQDKLSRQEAELQKAIGNNKELYDQDWANYAAATGYKISATEDFVTAWGDTTLAGMMGLDDTTSFTSVIGSAAESLVSGLLDAANTYYNNVDAANEAAGTSTGQFAEVLQENIDAINTESAEAAKAVEEMASKMDTAMQDIMDKTAEWQREHSKNIEKIIADNIKAAQSYNGLLEYLSNNAVGDYEVLIRGSSNGSGEGQGSSDGAADAVSCDTGGYTGNWGTSDGKLAWLHEKELVLNQSDTANMLKAIEMTRYLMSVIDAQANQLSQGLGSLQAATIHEERQETLEQHVEIKADFPNVSNHTEIEEALGNLINTASQYANRRK